MTRIHTTTRWAIVGRCGIYTGQWLTRRAAIVAHVRDMGLGNHLWISGGYTLDQIREGWRHWHACGDRAVKVTITWKEPAK